MLVPRLPDKIVINSVVESYISIQNRKILLYIKLKLVIKIWVAFSAFLADYNLLTICHSIQVRTIIFVK